LTTCSMSTAPLCTGGAATLTCPIGCCSRTRHPSRGDSSAGSCVSLSCFSSALLPPCHGSPTATAAGNRPQPVMRARDGPRVCCMGREEGWAGAPRRGPSAPPARESRAEGAPSPPAAGPDVQELKTMTLGLAATLNTRRARLDQLALGQEQSASDIAKLQAA